VWHSGRYLGIRAIRAIIAQQYASAIIIHTYGIRCRGESVKTNNKYHR